MSAVPTNPTPYAFLTSATEEALTRSVSKYPVVAYKIYFVLCYAHHRITLSQPHHHFYCLSSSLKTVIDLELKKISDGYPISPEYADSASIQLDLFITYQKKKYQYHAIFIQGGKSQIDSSPLLSLEKVNEFYERIQRTYGLIPLIHFDQKGRFTAINLAKPIPNMQSCLVQ